MSWLNVITVALFVVWCLSEVAISAFSLVNRRRNRRAKVEDRLSFLGMWLALIVSVAFAMIAWQSRTTPAGLGDVGVLRRVLGWLGCACLASGVAIRVAAAVTLRGQFTTTVTVATQQRIVDRGPYRHVRHPAYLGVLLSMLGFGLCSGSWISWVVAVVLPLGAVVYRIRVEERALLRHFGGAYAEYSTRTSRLVPGVY